MVAEPVSDRIVWLDRDLAEIQSTWVLAHAELAPGSAGSGVRGSEQPIGVRVSALSWVEGSDPAMMLLSWERLIREERDLVQVGELGVAPAAVVCADGMRRLCVKVQAGSPGAVLAASVTFLKAHLPWAAEQSWATDFGQELASLAREGRLAARRAREALTLVDCPTLDCTGRLKLPSDLDADAWCPACRTSRSVRWLILAAGGEVWADGEAVASEHGLSARTLRRWAKEGRIRRDGSGRYHVGSVREAIVASVEKPA